MSNIVFPSFDLNMNYSLLSVEGFGDMRIKELIASWERINEGTSVSGYTSDIACSNRKSALISLQSWYYKLKSKNSAD